MLNSGETFCENCGDCPAPYSHDVWDSCPTDRGELRTDYTIYFCEECEREVGRKMERRA